MIIQLIGYTANNQKIVWKYGIESLWIAICWDIITCAFIATLFITLSKELLSIFITEKQGVIHLLYHINLIES